MSKSAVLTRFAQKIKKIPWQWGLLLFVFFTFVTAAPLVAHAQIVDGIGSAIAKVVAAIGFLLIQHVLGYLVVTMVNILIWISGYNDFANSLAVVNGWVVVRDIANMFFIIILLIVALATILGQEEYHYKKLLPKLVVMALLINFSRTIAGLMIDASQVVMITFVNGYSAAAGGNFANALGILEILKLNEGYFGTAINEYQLAGAAIFGVAILLIANIVITVLVAVLAFRIIMLWILIVLSPMAWLMGTFPQGQKYYVKWWDEFRNQVVIGPALAFFLWLSLATVGSGKAFDQVSGGREKPTGEGSSVTISQIGAMDSIISFIISIGMLLAGLQVGQEMGGAIAGIMSKAKGAAINSMKLGAKVGVGGLGFLERKQAKFTNVRLNPMIYAEKLKSVWQNRKMMEEAQIAGQAGKSAEEWASGKGTGVKGWVSRLGGGRVGGLIGIGQMAVGSPADFFDNYMGWRGVRRFGGVILGGAKRAAELEKEIEEEDKEKGIVGLSGKRKLMRTQKAQDDAKQKVININSDYSRVAGRIWHDAELFSHGDFDLSSKENRTFAQQILNDLKERQKKMKESGLRSEAAALKPDIKVIDDAITRGDTLHINGLSVDIGKEVRDKVDGMIKNLQGELDNFDKKKKIIQIDIDLANRNGLVFATEDAKKAAVKEISEKIRKIQKQAAFRTPPRAYYAAENARHLEAEERKGMPNHAMEATEALEELHSALQEKNKIKFSAWMKKLTQDGNDNEIWNGFGYDSSVADAMKFRKDILVKELGMTEQESMALMNDVNYMNEDIGHYDITRMYQVKHGVFKENTIQEQAAIVANENLKKDSRKFCQNTNRLGYGGETADGKYGLGLSGLTTLVANQTEILNRIDRGEMNQSALNKFTEVINQLEQMEKKNLFTARNKEGKTFVDIIRERRRTGVFKEGASMSDMRKLVNSLL
ncbi:MAG: hypothetical protein Q8M83_00645 [bacterium]|nr:hypothetical protein [bacterium]